MGWSGRTSTNELVGYLNPLRGQKDSKITKIFEFKDIYKLTGETECHWSEKAPIKSLNMSLII